MFGFEIVNCVLEFLWIDMFGKSVKKLLLKNGVYMVINGYVYFFVKLNLFLIVIKFFFLCFLCRIFMNSVVCWEMVWKGYEDVIK